MKKTLNNSFIILFIIVIGIFLDIPQSQLIKFINENNLVVIDESKPDAVTLVETVKVTRVIDGDTIEIEGGKKVRYIGIDTPESKHPSKPVQCFSAEATKKNKELVEGKEVRLEKDVSETDRYGRLLRYVYVGDDFINNILVSEGFAQSSAYPPDIKHQSVFDESQRQAIQNSKGLWGDICN